MSKNIGKILAGIGIGIGIGMLIAPDKGSETRKKLKNKLNEMYEKIKNIDAEDIKNQIEDIKRELAELDKEKVLKIAKEKGKAIVKKSEELYKSVVKKGTPMLEKAADDIRLTAIDVLNSLTEKLEKKGN